jgi:hypothetical protein
MTWMPRACPVLLQQIGVALDVVVADEIDGVFGGDGRLDGAHLLVDPADVEDVVALGLTDAGEAGAFDGEDVDIGARRHHRLATALTSSPMRAVGQVV